MPTSYFTPGVYVEWLDANPQRIDIGRTDVAGFVGIAERGPVQTPVKIESARQFLTTFGDPIPDGYLAYAVAGFFENDGRTCWVVRVADPAQAVPARIRLFISGRPPFVLEAVSPGAWGNAIVIEAQWGRDRITHVIARAPDDRIQTIDLDQIDEASRPAGVRTNLLGVADIDLPELAPDVIVRVVADSQWVPVEDLSVRAPRTRLAGGTDGLASLRPEHFTGDPDRDGVWGVAALGRVDGVSFVAVPDLMAGQDPAGSVARRPRPAARPVTCAQPEGQLRGGQTPGGQLPGGLAPGFTGFSRDQVRDAQIAVINSCILKRDRMAILDMPPLSRDQVINYKDRWPSTSFAAFYHPWVIVDDPLRLRANVRAIPPSGHVAGMYARTDRRRGVHKPPANELLEGVFDLREMLDDRAHGELNERAINAIRVIPGRGVLVLGARTLDADFRWRYVNVRRLFTMIEEALDEQMQWLTFEPNNPRLWREIDRAVRGFLERLYRLGMLDGETSEKAYLVRCDDSTNPPWETDQGRVTCVIGIQPPYPAEFVVVRIGVTRNGIEIEGKGPQDV